VKHLPILIGGEEATGLTVHPLGKAIALSTGVATEDGFHGHIHIISGVDVSDRTVALRLSDGTVPYDPAYDTSGEFIAYAGFCKHDKLACWKTAPGWNIFSLELSSGLVELHTQPGAGYIPWRPKYGPEGSLYFVGINAEDDAFGTFLTHTTSIFKISESGVASAILPTRTETPHGIFLYNPIGNFRYLDIVAVRGDHLVIEGAFSARSTFPKRMLELTKRRGDQFDMRMLDLADRLFYSNKFQVSQWIGTRTYRTIFFVGPEKITALDEVTLTGETVPKYTNARFAMADDEFLWAFASENYTFSDVFTISENKVERVQRAQPWPPWNLRAKDIGGNLSAYLIQSRDGRTVLQTNRAWSEIKNFNIGEADHQDPFCD